VLIIIVILIVVSDYYTNLNSSLHSISRFLHWKLVFSITGKNRMVQVLNLMSS